MEMKLKEKIDVKSFTFKKKVMEEAIELLGRKRNYTLNDLRFIVMITFTNNLVENNLIIETLYKEEDIEEKMENIVEPFFKEEVENKPEVLESFNDVVNQLIEYMNREVEMRLTLSGFLYDLNEELGGLTLDDITKFIAQAMSTVGGTIDFTKGTPKLQPTNEEIKNEVTTDMANMKMKALIEKYMRQENKEEDAE